MRLGRTSAVMMAGAIALCGMSYIFIPPGSAESKWVSSTQIIQQEFLNENNVRPLSPSAARVALTALSMSDDPFSGYSISALSSSPVAEIDLGRAGTLQVAILNDDTGNIAQNLLAVSGDERSPVVLERGQREAAVALNYERRFETRGEGDQLDVSLTPRAGVSVGPDGSAAGAGAELRVGRYLADGLTDRPSWYVFAGADRRALLYNPEHGMDFNEAVYLTHREVIGDAQAGIAVRMGEADLSLAYVHREYQHVAGVTSFDETESFGAVTLNWQW